MDSTDSKRLATMLDKQDIADCIVRLARGMDRHDVELARSCFHADGRDDHAIFIGSGFGMIDWANGFHDSQFRGHQHLLTNMLIEIDGDEAHVETYVTLVAGSKFDWSHLAGGGRYLDRLERRNSRWGIVDRITTVEWWSDSQFMEQAASLVHPFAQDRSDPSYTRPLRVTREFRNLTNISEAE